MTTINDPKAIAHLEGLRLFDSSIMSDIIGGNTMAPPIMIGEKPADMIKAD